MCYKSEWAFWKKKYERPTRNEEHKIERRARELTGFNETLLGRTTAISEQLTRTTAPLQKSMNRRTAPLFWGIPHDAHLWSILYCWLSHSWRAALARLLALRPTSVQPTPHAPRNRHARVIAGRRQWPRQHHEHQQLHQHGVHVGAALLAGVGVGCRCSRWAFCSRGSSAASSFPPPAAAPRGCQAHARRRAARFRRGPAPGPRGASRLRARGAVKGVEERGGRPTPARMLCTSASVGRAGRGRGRGSRPLQRYDVWGERERHERGCERARD